MSFIQNQCGIKQSAGTIWMNTGNWTGVSVTLSSNTYKEMASLGTNFTLMPTVQDFAMSTDGRLKYTGIDTRNFIANASINAGNDSRFSIAIYKNGSLITGAESYSNSTNAFINENVKVSLATNDYLSVWLQRLTGTTVRVYQVTLGAISTI